MKHPNRARRLHRIFALGLALSLSANGVLAQGTAPAPAVPPTTTTSLDELERQIEAAQAADAARKAKPAARPATTAATTPVARQGTLIVKASRDCVLTINGTQRGELSGDRAQVVQLNVGEQLIECTAADGQHMETTHRIPADEQVVVRLEFPAPASVSAATPDEEKLVATAPTTVAVPNAEVFCSKLSEVVKTRMEKLKGKQSMMPGSFEPRVRLPNSEWCSIHTMPGFAGRPDRPYYSCRLLDDTDDLAGLAARYRGYADLIGQCLGTDWTRDDREDDQDSSRPGESEFIDADNSHTVELRLGYDREAKVETGDLMIYVNEILD